VADICPKCGLPKELCTCEALDREKQKITVAEEQKRFKKVMTVIRGLDDSADTKRILKELKTRLACGGTYKNGEVELQGRHSKKIPELLVELGFSRDQIELV
jgi:translation initiation factor 1